MGCTRRRRSERLQCRPYYTWRHNKRVPHQETPGILSHWIKEHEKITNICSTCLLIAKWPCTNIANRVIWRVTYCKLSTHERVLSFTLAPAIHDILPQLVMKLLLQDEKDRWFCHDSVLWWSISAFKIGPSSFLLKFVFLHGVSAPPLQRSWSSEDFGQH